MNPTAGKTFRRVPAAPAPSAQATSASNVDVEERETGGADSSDGPTVSGGNLAAGPEDGDIVPEDELSETDLADPTDEYNEVEKKSLREAALTIEYKLTHRVKHLFCDSCVRGIMNNKKTKVGAFDRQLTHWGQLATSGHIDSKGKKQLGFSGKRRPALSKMCSQD